MGGLLGAFELSALRSVAESSMGGTAVIYRQVFTSDGAGGQSGSVVAAGTVLCRAVPVRSRPQVGAFGGRVEAHGDWNVYVPVGTDVRASTDHIVAGGGTFDVLSTNAGRTDAVEIRCACLQRR